MQPNLTMVLEQVGKDKGIDVKILLQTLEQAILTAAKKVFGMHRELEAQVQRGDRRRRSLPDLLRRRGTRRREGPRDHAAQTPQGTASRPSSATSCCSRSSIAPRTPTAPREQEREVRRPPRPARHHQEVRPHRRADRQAGDHPARARGRARQRLQRVQGSQGRAHLRHRASLRARQPHRRDRPPRGDPARARAGAARVVSRRRPHHRLRASTSRRTRAARRSSCRARTRACSRSCSSRRSPRSTRRSCASSRRPASRARAPRSPCRRATATSIRSAPASA